MNDSNVRDDEGFSIAYHHLILLLCMTTDAGMDEAAMSLVISRFKNLQKLGVPSGKRPAQGKRQKYTLLQACEWVLSFALLQCGLDQASAARMVADTKSPGQDRRPTATVSYMAREITKALINNSDPWDGSRQFYLVFSANLLIYPLTQQDARLTFSLVGSVSEIVTHHRNTTLIDFGRLLDEVRKFYSAIQVSKHGTDPKTRLARD